MTDIEWSFFRGTLLGVLGGGGLAIGLMMACTVAAQPTPIQRQLELCRIDNANLKAALVKCESK